jgi:hypothetical protein
VSDRSDVAYVIRAGGVRGSKATYSLAIKHPTDIGIVEKLSQALKPAAGAAA